MDLDLLPALLGLADSFNPSALVVALWLLSRAHATPRLLAYVGGILAAYLGLGVAMMLGLDAMRRPLAALFAHPFAVAAQALVGAGLLAYALSAPSKGQAPAAAPVPGRGQLAAYVLLSLGRLEARGYAYQWMNVVGAGGFIINSGYNGAIPSAALNVVWAAMGLFTLWAVWRARNAAGRGGR